MATTRYTFDALGQLHHIIDNAGHVTSMTYDDLGRRTSLDNPDAGLTTYRYDPSGNLVSKVTPNLSAKSEAIDYSYDFNRLTDIDYPETGKVRYAYGSPGAPHHAAGRVTKIKDDAGTATMAYGALGEVVDKVRTLPPLRPGQGAERFELKYRYDSLGRMQTITYPDGEVVSYAYDAGGQVNQVTGTVRADHWNPTGQVTYVQSLTYTVFGARRHLELGNGDTSDYGYDALTRRLTSLETRAHTGRELQKLTYDYDRVGDILGESNGIGPATAEHSGPTEYHFQYDGAYRLTHATGTSQARIGVTDKYDATYSYSPIHNMGENKVVRSITSTLGGTPVTDYPKQTDHDWKYTYDPTHPHQATRIGDKLFQYDPDGNLTTACRADAKHPDSCQGNSDHLRRLYWDDADRLSAVVDTQGRRVTRFVYDAGGNRVIKEGHLGTSITVGPYFNLRRNRLASVHVMVGATRIATHLEGVHGWGAQGPTAHPGSGGGVPGQGTGPQNTNGCDPSNYQPQKCPIDASGSPIAVSGGDEVGRPHTYFYHPDHLGSTSWVTDEAGRVREHVLYFPYGSVWRDAKNDAEGAPPRTQAFLFTGKEYDQETGYYYFGARYYDPQVARWLSVDPLPVGKGTDALHLALYVYSGWSPVTLVDPDGRNWLTDLILGRKPIQEGAAYQQFEAAWQSASNPSNTWAGRIGDGVLGTLAGLVALPEHYAALPLANVVYTIRHRGASTLTHAGLAYHAAMAGQWGDFTLQCLYVVRDGAATLDAVLSLAVMADPDLAHLELRMPKLGSSLSDEIDAAFAQGRVKSGTMVRFTDSGGALDGSGPREGQGSIWYHDNLKIPGAGPNGEMVDLRTHSPNPTAPDGTYSQGNYTTQINTRGTPKLYRLPDGQWKDLNDMSAAERSAAHYPAGN